MKRTIFSVLLLALSAIAAVFTSAAADAPLTAVYQASTHSVTLAWTASSDCTTTTPCTTAVFVATNGTQASPCATTPTFTQIGTAALGINTFSDTPVSAGSVRCYTVQAVLNGVSSVNSATASTVIPPSAHTGLGATHN